MTQDTSTIRAMHAIGILDPFLGRNPTISLQGLYRATKSELDLSYIPPLGSPWDLVQMGVQRWERLAFSISEQAERRV
jgi:hypothetical protein